MKLILILAVFAASTHAASYLKWSPNSDDLDLDIDEEWRNFKKTHDRMFHSSGDEGKRKAIFAENLKEINDHNRNYARGLASFTMGVNQFSDLTYEEFSETMLLSTELNMTSTGERTFKKYLDLGELPSEVDWRKKGGITPVKNQGNCRSCYTFAATGAIEGHYFAATGKLVSLSEQNIIDCSMPFGNDGCDGGLAMTSFEYIKYAHGIDTEESYPYKAKKKFRCKFNKENIGASITDYKVLPYQNHDLLKEALANLGPVAVSILASPKFKHYKSGVMEDPVCPGKLHAVLVVGYGTEDGKDYYLVKNSFGAHWGDNGYIKMARKNECQIADLAVYPII